MRGLVLEWISIYWFSRAGPAASARIYYEMSEGGAQPLPLLGGWTSVPVGVSYFPAEIVHFPKLYVFNRSTSAGRVLTPCRIGGQICSGSSCSRESMMREGTSPHSRSRRSLLETSVRCMGRVDLRMASFQGRWGMTHEGWNDLHIDI